MEMNIFSTAARKASINKGGEKDAPLQAFRKDCWELFSILAA